MTVLSLSTSTVSTTVYNLTVDGIPSYCVLSGDDPVLVHNAGCSRLNLKSMATNYLKRVLKREGTNPHQLKTEILGRKAPISEYDVLKCSKCHQLNIVRKGNSGDPIGTGIFD